MPRKKISAEAENPMETEAMGNETMEAESGWQEREGDGGDGSPPDVFPGDSPCDGSPLPDGDGPYSGGLPPDESGPYPGADSLMPDGVDLDSGGASAGEDGQPPGGIPPEWGTDSADSGGYADNSPDSMGGSPDALSGLLEGVEVPMRGDEPGVEERDIPYGEDGPEDDPSPPDGSPSGGFMPGAEMTEDMESGGATMEAVEAVETAPPVPVETPRRGTAQTRAGTTDDSAPAASARSDAGTGGTDRAGFRFRTPAPAPVTLAPAPAAAEPAHRSIVRRPAGTAADRAAFFGLQFNKLDRNLTPEQRQEWNSIYASYRGRSAMSGAIVGVDRALVQAKNPQTGEMEYRHLYFAVVIPYRVRIVIPETEMWFPEEERPNFVLRNMDGAKIDFVIFKVDRENGLAVGSRKMALPTRRYYFSTQPGMNRPGSRVQCNIMAVGPRRCLVNCHGYDLDMSQREMSWKSIPDLRDVYHNGDTLDCIVKEYDSRENRLVISVKETEPNPFDGADFRHPEGCSRVAVITGKYGGGVFCTLPDDVTVMCNYAFQYDDSTFSIGDRVILMVERYEYEKKQVYGKIVAKR